MAAATAVQSAAVTGVAGVGTALGWSVSLLIGLPTRSAHDAARPTARSRKSAMGKRYSVWVRQKIAAALSNPTLGTVLPL